MPPAKLAPEDETLELLRRLLALTAYNMGMSKDGIKLLTMKNFDWVAETLKHAPKREGKNAPKRKKAATGNADE